MRHDKDKIEWCDIFCLHRKALKCQKKVLKEIREMVSLSSIFDMDNTTRVLLVSSILRNLLSVGIMQNYGIILTWCFLCLFARTCPNINMTEWLPNLWIFWTSCTHRKRTCSNWLTELRYSKELNFYFPPIIFL